MKMIEPNKLKLVEKYVKENIIDKCTWIHTLAVRSVAAEIANKEDGNKEIIDLAVLFYDIERGKWSPEEHALKGAEIVKKVMATLDFDKEMIEKVVHCVAAHSNPWAKTGPIPKTIEAKIVYDADMVQQVSPFGIIKYIHKFGDKDFNEMLKMTADVIINKVPTGIFTDTAKEMINQRMPYVKDFFARAKK